MKTYLHLGYFFAVFVLLFALPSVPLLRAQTIVVTNTTNFGPGTLPGAIALATNGETITFATNLSGATITVNDTLMIDKSLTIDASALPGGIRINGNNDQGPYGIFFMDVNGITVTLNSLTITNGNSYYGGGGIASGSTVILNECSLSGNSANAEGGGILNGGTMILNECTLSDNSTGIYGGGIFNEGTMTLNECTLSGNSSTHNYAGGIFNEGTMILNECTLSGNTASAVGGGIFNFSTLMLDQCTLSGNVATNAGGGIYDQGTLTAVNTIVAGNTSSQGADIFESGGALTYGGSNLVESITNINGMICGPAPLANAPNLAPLGNYGGPTQTMPPLPGSPVIGAGSITANTFTNDQRGFPRTQNGLIDIGAVEAQTASANDQPILANAAWAGHTFQFTFANISNADFTVLMTTNLSLPPTDWMILGNVPQGAPGQFLFTDTSATNNAQFYELVSP